MLFQTDQPFDGTSTIGLLKLSGNAWSQNVPYLECLAYGWGKTRNTKEPQVLSFKSLKMNMQHGEKACPCLS